MSMSTNKTPQFILDDTIFVQLVVAKFETSTYIILRINADH